MPKKVKVQDVGEFVAYSGIQSAIKHYVATGDQDALEQGKRLAMSFLAAIEQAPAGTQTASDTRIQATLTQIERLIPKEQPPPECPVPEPSPDPTPDPTSEPPSNPSQRCNCGVDRLGLGLSLAGGLASAGGLALFIAGVRQVPWYEARLSEFGWSPDSTDYDYDTELDKARRSRNINIGVGITVTSIGIGILSYGLVRLKRHRIASKRATQTMLEPFPIPRGGGLAFQTIF